MNRRPEFRRRELVLAAPLGLALPALARAAAPGPAPASYRVSVASLSPLRFSIRADLPIEGRKIRVSDTYPAELPSMAKGGWPSLISNLRARDAGGGPVEAIGEGDKGWRLSRPISGRVELAYDVDFSVFGAAHWSSPLESAIVDADKIAVTTRGLFLFTEATREALIGFDLPATWRVAAPWLPSARPGTYRAASVEDLVDNAIALARQAPDVVAAGGFRLQITAMGHWQPLRPAIRRALQAIVSREVSLMGWTGREAYNVILVPMQDIGGEAYRQSFLYGFKDPTHANMADWANTMAHEIFHYWNYARLKGADYASTQWFQEGFTEYVANLTLVGGGIAGPDWFLGKLSRHVANYRRLTTTLENIGTHKGPPLYSGGALVAFGFDVMIRRATERRGDIGSLLRNLWRLTQGGTRKYAWPDIEAALRVTAPGEWQDFYLRHIRGNEPLPLARLFGAAGLTLTETEGNPLVGIDRAALPAASAVRRSLIGDIGG